MEIKGAYRQNLFSISFASSTSTILNFFSSFSFDQSGHLSFNASSGATGSILSENSRSIVLPFDNMPEQMMFASTIVNDIIFYTKLMSFTYSTDKLLCTITFVRCYTMIIHFSPEYFFLYFSCIDFEILLPISIASFSVSVLFATIDLNKASSASLSRIASLATSDQFMNFDSSIFCFMSSGTDNVIFGIKFTSHITHNTHKYLKLANAVITSLKSKASSKAQRTGSSLQQCGKILVFVNVGEGNVANAVEELKT